MILTIEGDATDFTSGVLVHIVSNAGHIGGGFSGDVIRKWPIMEQAYRLSQPLILGQIQPMRVDEDRWVVNMIAQHGTFPSGSMGRLPPIRYAALQQCLTRVAAMFPHPIRIVMPRIGTGLAGGDWDKVSEIIELTLDGHSVNVFVLSGTSDG